jgi:hypothetical protein
VLVVEVLVAAPVLTGGVFVDPPDAAVDGLLDPQPASSATAASRAGIDERDFTGP